MKMRKIRLHSKPEPRSLSDYYPRRENEHPMRGGVFARNNRI